MKKIYLILIVTFFITSCDNNVMLSDNNIVPSDNEVSDKKISTQDSIEISNVVHGFYNWYSKEINEKHSKGFKPEIIKTAEGMSTLFLDNYLNNLRKNGFSQVLIEKEKESYQPCISELNKIKFKDLDTLDLYQIKKIKCDFGNNYRWGGGQEGIDGIKIHSCQKKIDTAIVVGEFYNQYGEEYHFWGRNQEIVLIQVDSTWKILNFK